MISQLQVRGLRSRARRGFTLIELIVVVLIIGILVAIAAVGYRTFIRNAQDTQAKLMLTQVAQGADGNAVSNTSYQLADFANSINHASQALGPQADGGTVTVRSGTARMDAPLQLHVALPAAGSGLFAGVAVMSASGNCFTAYVSGPTALNVTEAPLAGSYNYAGCVGWLATPPPNAAALASAAVVVTATPDTGAGLSGANIDVAVLANDTISNPGPGDTLTIASFTQPAHGTVTAVGGVLRYVSAGGFAGSDLFSYTASGGGQTSTANVVITVTAPLSVYSTISVGGSTPCAVADGKAYCWGYGGDGEFGDGNPSSFDVSAVPVAVSTSGLLAGKTVTAISSGSHTTCAVASGAAYCWGSNGAGQLGDGSTTSSRVPVAVNTTGALAGKTVTAISTSGFTTCAVASGAAYCWGIGPLGDGTINSSLVPVAVKQSAGVLAGKTVTAISTADLQTPGGASITCAVASGAAYCWGSNGSDGLGNGNNGDPGIISLVPVAVKQSAGVLAGKTVTNISVGPAAVCAVASGAAYCWGSNWNGEMGVGTSISVSSVPIAVSTSGVLAGKTVTAISTEVNVTCAVASGAAYCWGYALGNGTALTSGSYVPVAVSTSGVLAGKTVTAISASGLTTCAVASGAAYCWGYGGYGQLGNGTTNDSTLPVAVTHR